MNWVKGVFASLVVLFVFLSLTGQTQGVDKKTLTADSSKRVNAAPVVNFRGNSAVSAFSADMPAGQSSSRAIYFDSAKVEAVRASGKPLLYDGDPDKRPYKVISRQRNGGPEDVDVHVRQTDIWYIVGGKATIVTGGKLVNPKSTKPDQINGSAIEGGETYHLSKGDVFIIPKGVPHWCKQVDQVPFSYMEFKYTE